MIDAKEKEVMGDVIQNLASMEKKLMVLPEKL